MDVFNSFHNGVAGGARLADVFQERKDRVEISKLAQAFGQNQDYSALGAGLIANGQVGTGVNASNVPYLREQQELQRQFQNQQFQQSQANNDRSFNLQQQQYNDRVAQQEFQNQLNREKFDFTKDQGNSGGFTTPVQGVDSDGKPVFIQTNDRGVVKQVEGFSPNNPIKTIDYGTYVETVDSRTGQVMSRTSKQNRVEAFDKARGSAQGKSSVGKNTAVLRAQQRSNDLVNQIDAVLKHPALDKSVGALDQFRPSFTGSGIADFRGRVDQIRNTAFITVREDLKGGGAITDFEGKKAETALVRASDATSEAEFKTAMKEFKAAVERGMRLLESSKKETDRLAPNVGATGNGLSFSSSDLVTPASGDTVPVSGEELNDLLSKY